MDLLDEQLPGVSKKSSIAMSLRQLLPLMPSNVIYKDSKKQHINDRMKMIIYLHTYHLLTESEVMTGNSQTFALTDVLTE